MICFLVATETMEIKTLTQNEKSNARELSSTDVQMYIILNTEEIICLISVFPH